jgi:glycosyltransferase involved in cell wall biosynthesis
VRILFLLRSLDRGGAERQATALARALAARGHAVAVACFYEGGALADELAGTAARLVAIGKAGRWDVAGFLSSLARIVGRERPEVIYSYLTVPNIVAAALRLRFPRLRIVWGVRASKLDLAQYDRLTRLSYVVEPRLARCAHLVIANSRAGLRDAVAAGMPAGRAIVIENGVDTDRFAPDAAARQKLRASWSLAGDDLAIGLVARIDPMKGHRIFIDAISRLDPRRPLRFLCIGDGPAEAVRALRSAAVEAGVAERMLWLGARDDMPAVLSALDLVCSASIFGEGFSNAIAEAMACGVPAAATDVGDSAEIVGDTGEITAPGDPVALARAIEALIARRGADPVALSEAARRRIVERFSLARMVERTEAALLDLLALRVRA